MKDKFMAKKETVTEAFCRQNRIDPSSPEQSESDEIANGRLSVTYLPNGKKIEILRTNSKQEQQLAAAQMESAISLMGSDRSSNLRAHSNLKIPSQKQITPREGESLQKTIEHNAFKGYNHGLEKDRWALIGGKGGGGEIEMGDMGTEDL